MIMMCEVDSEFKLAMDLELKQLRENNKNKNTENSAKTRLKHLRKWAKKGGRAKLFLIIVFKQELHGILQHYYT